MIDKLNPLYARGVRPIPVIPTIYTDALSYGEQLGIMGHKTDECVEKVNEVVDDNNTFKTELTAQQNTFETDITNQQNTFETDITNQQSTYETDITNQQNTFESDMNTWKGNVESGLDTWKTNTYNTFDGQIDSLEGAYEQFLEDYQRQFGVVQTRGTSEENVMSQKAVSDMLPYTDVISGSTAFDFNSVEVNKVYGVNSTNVSNSPNNTTTFNGVVMTFGNAENTNIKSIIAIERITNYRSQMWFKIYFGNAWSEWKSVSIGQTRILQASEFNLNDAEINSVYTFNSATAVTNSPVVGTLNGTCFTYSIASYPDIVSQLVMTYGKEMYYRIKFGSWGTWTRIYGSNDLLFVGNGAETGTIDFNNFTSNGTWVVVGQNNVANSPIPYLTGLSGILVTYTTSDASVKAQMFIGFRGGIFYRMYFASWRSWSKIASPQNEQSYKAFKDVGIIGDSLSNGACAYSVGGTVTYMDNPYYSWGKFLERESGNNYTLFAQGGINTRTYVASSLYTDLQDVTKKQQCYIISLGVNDRTLGVSYIGSESDIDGGADTFYGNYGKIVKACKTNAPHSKIFLITIPDTGDLTDAFNTAIRNIASHFTDNVYLLDLAKYRSAIVDNDNQIYCHYYSGHYDAVGYEAISHLISEMINTYMQINFTEFYNVELINTPYEDYIR